MKCPRPRRSRIFHNDMDFWRRKWVGSVAHRLLDRPAGAVRINGPLAQAVQKAAEDMQAGRTVEAEVAFRDILDIDPNDVNALNLLGVITLQNGMIIVSYDLFCRAIAILPTHPQLFVHRAAALTCVGRNEEAMHDYVEATRLENQSAPLLDAIATELSKLGYEDQAAAARTKAASIRQAAAAPGVMTQQ